MKESDKMIYAIAISSAIASGIMNYKEQTKPPEPTPVVQTVEQPKQPEPCIKETTPQVSECK
tara:strand:+ start:194 stop:379 length:186 start_codon:yes stop_codon:yes gene_type:complete